MDHGHGGGAVYPGHDERDLDERHRLWREDFPALGAGLTGVRSVLALEVDLERLFAEHGVTVAQLHAVFTGRRVDLKSNPINLVKVLKRCALVAVYVGVIDENRTRQRHLRLCRQDLAGEGARTGDRVARARGAEVAEHLVPGVRGGPALLRARWTVAHEVVRGGRVVDLASVRVVPELLDAGCAVGERGGAIVRAAVIAARVRVLLVVVVRQLVAEDRRAAARVIDRRAAGEVVGADADDAEAAGVRIDRHISMTAAVALSVDPAVDVLGAR